MRKALIATIVAAALFAVGAFAAEFTLNSDDVASGTVDVVACASAADVDFITAGEGASQVDEDGQFEASGADISFTESPTGACEGQEVTIAIGLDTDADESSDVDSWEEYVCDDVATGESSCDFEHLVSEIEEVSVLVQENPVAVD